MPEFSRKNMPQVDTQNLSKAMDMVSDKAKITKGTISAGKLKKSQKELHQDKVEGIAKKFTSPDKFKPLVISKDNHIVDGHHRWGAAIYKWGKDVKIPIIRINLPILQAIKLYKEIALKLNQPVKETIKKVGDKYAVYPKRGGDRLGTHDTKSDAEKQLTAIEISKHKNEDITIPINVGDTVLGGKFKNKRIVVKSIDKNEKGDITINGKPLMKFRLVNEQIGYGIECKNCNHSWDIEPNDDRPYLCHNCGYDSQMQKIDLVGLRDWKKTLKENVAPNHNGKSAPYGSGYDEMDEANAVSGGKVHKLITGKNLTFKGKKYSDIEFEVLGIDNNSQIVKLKILAPKNLFGEELNVPFKTIRRGPFLKTDTSKQFEGTINEIPMGDLKQIDTFADKKLNPMNVVLTGKHFFDRLNDPRNGKEVTNAELIGFFKRLSKKKSEFVDFLNQYNQVVAVDDRTNLNIPFMKQANKAIAKTVMRKKDFKTSNKKLEI